jgi:lysophospholipase L1-like esterase
MQHFHSNRGRSLVASLAISLVLGMLLTAGGQAAPATSAGSPKGYYLALGDSITYGFQPTKARPGAGPSTFDTGYVDVFASRLRRVAPGIEVVNFGCPGESTVTFTRGGCPAFADGIGLHDPFRGSQLKAALSFLRGHPEDVSPITLTLYGNDWLPLLLDTCKGSVACVRKHAPKVTASFGSRLSSILKQLRAAAPSADIVVTGAWNPDPGQLRQLRSTYRFLEETIARAATASHARIAKMRPVFNPPTNAQAQRARLCALTFICSKGDPHPTDAGYRAMADAVAVASS